MRSSGSNLFPKERPLDVAMRSPGPTIVAPILLIAIAALLDKLIKFPVRNHVFTGKKIRNIHCSFSIFIVPPIRWEIGGFAKIHSVFLDSNHRICRVVDTFHGIRRRRILVIVSRRVDRRPAAWFLNQVVWSLTKKNGTRFEMNALVFKSHKQCPHWMRLVDFDRPIGIVQTRMIHDGIRNYVIDLFPVFMNFTDGRPQHVVLVHIIPQHLINSNLKNAFEVCVYRLLQNTSHT
mmetsp:Transcript_2902/g.5017  ORF Transcript_2902/g.5017 Transcript_2902/m.5017 type:complete len:234 (-) Transcript_2902:497-1198(-)